MTTQASEQVSLLQQIATFFAGPDTLKKPTKSTQSPAHPTEVEVVIPLAPPTRLLGDDSDGEEPADLALTELIPAGLSALNLPHYQEAQSLEAQIGPACLINACRLEDRPLTETEMEAAELAELIPTALSKLNIARAKAAIAMKEVRVTPQPLPDLATLQRTDSITETTTLQTAA
ncbi:MAG: hypothetical protein ACFB0D_02315 [Phormidesmis sp.]